MSFLAQFLRWARALLDVADEVCYMLRPCRDSCCLLVACTEQFDFVICLIL